MIKRILIVMIILGSLLMGKYQIQAFYYDQLSNEAEIMIKTKNKWYILNHN